MTDPGDITNPPPTHQPPPNPPAPRPVVVQAPDHSPALLEAIQSLPERVVDSLRESTKADPPPDPATTLPPAATTDPATTTKTTVGNRFHSWWFRK